MRAALSFSLLDESPEVEFHPAQCRHDLLVLSPTRHINCSFSFTAHLGHRSSEFRAAELSRGGREFEPRRPPPPTLPVITQTPKPFAKISAPSAFLPFDSLPGVLCASALKKAIHTKPLQISRNKSAPPTWQTSIETSYVRQVKRSIEGGTVVSDLPASRYRQTAQWRSADTWTQPGPLRHGSNGAYLLRLFSDSLAVRRRLRQAAGGRRLDGLFVSHGVRVEHVVPEAGIEKQPIRPARGIRRSLISRV